MKGQTQYKIPIFGVKLSSKPAPLSAKSFEMAKSIAEDHTPVALGGALELAESQSRPVYVDWSMEETDPHVRQAS